MSAKDYIPPQPQAGFSPAFRVRGLEEILKEKKERQLREQEKQELGGRRELGGDEKTEKGQHRQRLAEEVRRGLATPASDESIFPADAHGGKDYHATKRDEKR